MNETGVMTGRLVVIEGGHQEYSECLRLQQQLVAKKLAGAAEDYLLLVTHPPVITIGRSANRQDEMTAASLAAAGIQVVRARRGGRLTYHGPGQIVGYPIMRLSGPQRDLHRYLRNLETVIIAALGRYEIEAAGVPGKTGVWVQGKKVAAIGVAVRSWVTYHGFALNVNADLTRFATFSPCGLAPQEIGSLKSLGYNVAEDGLRAALVASCAEVFQRKIVRLERAKLFTKPSI